MDMKILILSTILLLSSCARLSPPPKVPLEKLAAISGEEELYQHALVLRNIDEGNINCQQLDSASDNKSIPLKKWARAQYLLNCEVDQGTIEEEFDEREEYPLWAQEDLYKALIKKTESKRILLASKLQITKFLKTQSEKVFNLKQALKVAKENNLEYTDIEKMLEVVAPRFTLHMTPENAYEVARDYERNREFDMARKIYKKIIFKFENTLKEKADAWNRIRFTYKLQHDRPTYLKETTKLVKFLKKKLKTDPSALELYAEYSIIRARILWTQDNLSLAKKVLRNLLLHKNLSEISKVTVYYYLGGIDEDLGRNRSASNFYEKAFNNIHDGHELRDTILWNIAWFKYRKKKYKEALSWFNRYSPAPDEDVNYKFYFWKAQTLKKLKKTLEANILLSKVRTEDPYGFYGQIAHMDDLPLAPIEPGNDKKDLQADALSWAVYIKNYDLARKIIDYEDVTNITDYYASQYFNKMIFKFFSFDREKRHDILESMPNFSFPMAYKKEFVEQNRSKRVATPLLLSIARQESAFNPLARSPADAFGLLQIIPAQAKRLSRRYKVPYNNFNDLYKPETNIALSSLLLNELMKRQKNNFIHFVASYNAGETPVRRWKKRIRANNDLEFIEQIPYKETRKYVKLVTRNYLIYRRMLSNKEFMISRNFFRKGHMYQ
jgi:soluble lytic murein transglycosylase